MAVLEYLSRGEARAVRALVNAAIDAGYFVSVHDGEVWEVKQARKAETVLAALGHTEGDTLRLRHPLTREVVGDFVLIYGNAPDGSEVVADHTDVGPLFDILDAAGLV